MEEFHPRRKMANVYFLVLASLQTVPAITNTFQVPTILLPLSAVVIVDAIFAIIEVCIAPCVWGAGAGAGARGAGRRTLVSHVVVVRPWTTRLREERIREVVRDKSWVMKKTFRSYKSDLGTLLTGGPTGGGGGGGATPP